MKKLICLVMPFLMLSAHADYVSLFDGKSLDGWKSNDDTPGCFTISDGAIKISGGRAHLFYVGKVNNADFKNFEFKAKVMTTKGSNSGIYFHTKFQEKGWPSAGYECQVNNTHGDPRKTASLYAIKDVNPAPAKDDEWFDYEIIVEGKQIIVKINGETITDYTEPADLDRPERQLSSGTFALQAHDPGSKVYYRDLKVKKLAD